MKNPLSKKEDSMMRIDRQALRFAGKVFPLRNIAYLEKIEVKRKTGIGKVFFLTILVAIGVALAFYVEAETFVAVGLAFIVAVYVAWITYLVLRRKNFVLALQT